MTGSKKKKALPGHFLRKTGDPELSRAPSSASFSPIIRVAGPPSQSAVILVYESWISAAD